MMLNFRTGLTALLVAGVGSAFAQTVHFYDGFETGTVGSDVQSSIWNAAPDVAAGVGYKIASSGSYLSGVTTFTVAPASGLNMLFGDVSTATRPRPWGKIDPAIDTASKVLVLSVKQFDPLNHPQGGNARNFTQIADYSTDFLRVSPSGLSDLLAQGVFNAVGAQTAVSWQANGAQGGPGSPIASRYALRKISVAPGFGIPDPVTGLPGNTGPDWFFVGVDNPLTAEVEVAPRSRGWHTLTTAVDNLVMATNVDGIPAAVVPHGRTRTWDQISFANVTTVTPTWYDDILVRSFDPGSINLKVILSNLSESADLSTIPVSLTVQDSTANPAVGSPFTGLTLDSFGTVTATTSSRGLYNMVIKAPTFLSKVLSNVDIQNVGVHGLVATLINGDVDDDGEVGPGDFELVVANFGTSVGPELGDLDRDGEVGPSDFEIVVANFGIAGENP